jgi:hypothetical protein
MYVPTLNVTLGDVGVLLIPVTIRKESRLYNIARKRQLASPRKPRIQLMSCTTFPPTTYIDTAYTVTTSALKTPV